MNPLIYEAFKPSARNFHRWAWCLSCAVCLLAWASGQSAWAGAAAFNAFAVVWTLSTDSTKPTK
jgi:hypothetical protein